ncbi:MAG: hypothetical protein ABSF91_01310 [Bacteroidota bacterium]
MLDPAVEKDYFEKYSYHSLGCVRFGSPAEAASGQAGDQIPPPLSAGLGMIGPV